MIHRMGRIGFMGLGIALVGALSGAPVFAADKPVEDGSKIMITSPKDKDKVSDSFELKYELTKGSQAAHAHVFGDNEYQKGFQGTVKGMSKGTHHITVTGAERPRPRRRQPYYYCRRAVILHAVIFNATRASCERGPGAGPGFTNHFYTSTNNTAFQQEMFFLDDSSLFPRVPGSGSVPTMMTGET